MAKPGVDPPKVHPTKQRRIRKPRGKATVPNRPSSGQILKDDLRLHWAQQCDRGYLNELAKDHKALYVSLIRAIIPAEQAISITAQVVDLGAELTAAAEQLTLLSAEIDMRDRLVDITPTGALPSDTVTRATQDSPTAPRATHTEIVDGDT